MNISVKPIIEEQNEELLFDDPPYSLLSRSFNLHIQKTQHPESFSGLSWSKPPNNLVGSVILSPFDIDRNRRKGHVRCCNCNGREKFLDGMLIWSPDKKIRIIGNKCAQRIDKDTADSMLRSHKNKKKEERDTDFLENNLKLIPSIYKKVECLFDPCKQVSEYRWSTPI